MNTTVSPGDDFYEYVNGAWIKSHSVPSDKSRYGSFDIVADETYERVKGIVTSAANNTTAPIGSLEQKIGEFYRVGMDNATIERQRLESIRAELKRIDEVSNISDVQAVSTHMLSLGIGPFFDLYASPDSKNSRIMIATLSQGGLGLPDRDFYFRQDNESNKTREQYVAHVAKMFSLMGDDPDVAETNSQTVMRIETRLANASFTNVNDMDQTKTYNKMSLKELQDFAPGIDWPRLFADAGCLDIDYVNVRNPSFFKELSTAMGNESVEDWKTFLRWSLISFTASYLSSDFVDERFDFYARKLNGQAEIKPRWKRVLDAENGAMGELIGRVYVDMYFDSLSKAKMVDLVSNLKKAFAMRIQNLTWMEPETKKKAIEKLNILEVQVGYPDEWLNYTGLDVKNDSYVQNVLRGSSFQFHHGPSGVDRIGKAVNKKLWRTNPQTVNAFANYKLVLMIFPAGILQPPFFDSNADDAVNYGAIGMAIGHEMTHNFDSEGRKFDAYGNMTDWWTPGDAASFNNSTRVLVDEYNKFEILPDLFINGNLTLAENIGDLGGLTIAYDAYKLSQSSEPEKIDGFTGDQRFFLSNAQMWRESNRIELLRTQVLTNTHSPAKFRVNGAVFNVPEFYNAFPEVQSGDKLYRPPAERPAIW
ncbi:MAG TPA: M13-type metalloendopeptidase [Methanotrichaceae archaeon]|nr:M13-type metalloendopeptidase [Methanotrichaceae archaeon]